MRRAAALLAAAHLLGAPAAAPAQDSPLAPLPQAPTTPQQTVVAPPNTGQSSGDGLGTWQQILIFGAGVVLLGGIGYAIVSDARSKAPVRGSEAGHPGVTVKRNRSRKQRERERAKAKRGRRQRRRTRRR